jgi:uncharacterized membrane protein
MYNIEQLESYFGQSTTKRLSILKQPILSVINDHLIAYPTPSNLNYFWGFGSLAGLSLVIQIVTGVFLACHYTPDVNLAFSSVEHIMTDVQGGFVLRYAHANGASMFFMVTFVHMLRSLYYASYQAPREAVWIIGVVILFLMIATAFLGYSLPFGQQSLWGISGARMRLWWFGNSLLVCESGWLIDHFNDFRALKTNMINMYSLTNLIDSQKLRDLPPLTIQTVFVPLSFSCSRGARVRKTSRIAGVGQGGIVWKCTATTVQDAKLIGARSCLSRNEKRAQMATKGTFDMRFGQKPARRRAVRVALQQTSLVKYDQGNKSLALYCQVPQLDFFISIATKAMIKMGKIDWDNFYVVFAPPHLLVGQRPHQKVGLSFRAKNHNQYLGRLNLNPIVSNPSFLLYCYGLIKNRVLTSF